MKLHKQIRVRATPRQVFSYWSNFRNFRQFIPIIEEIDVIDAQRSRWIIRAPLNHRVSFESLITTSLPGEKLVWESTHPDGYARGELRLRPSGEYTVIELDFEYSLQRRWMHNIAQIVGRFGFPSLAFDHGLARIRQEIEKDGDNQPQP